MNRWVAWIACCGLIITCGLVHGVMTDRWTDPEDIEQAVRNFEDFPLDVGDWKGKMTDQNASKESGLAACVEVRYQNEVTGKTVKILFGCGRPGPVSVHTPDVCYTASGFDVDPQSTESFPTPGNQGTGKLLTARFKRARGSEQTLLRFYWTWFANNEWAVSDNPRLQFHRQQILYKLYVVHELESLNDPPSPDVCQDLLPKLTQALEQSVILKSR